MSPLKALALAFGAIGRLPFWPGDAVMIYGEKRTYVKRVASGFHIVVTDEGREQICPPESVSVIGVLHAHDVVRSRERATLTGTGALHAHDVVRSRERATLKGG